MDLPNPGIEHRTLFEFQGYTVMIRVLCFYLFFFCDLVGKVTKTRERRSAAEVGNEAQEKQDIEELVI